MNPNIPPPSLANVCAILVLPVCAVLLVVLLRHLSEGWRERRRQARKRRALRERRIYLEKL